MIVSAERLSKSAHGPPIATARGISLNLIATEPVLFLEGYNKDDPSTRKCNVLRGQLHVKLTQTINIKRIWIQFRGRIKIKWPDGNCVSQRTLLTQGITYFDHGDTAMQHNEFGADYFQFSDIASAVKDKANLTATTNTLLQKNKYFASKVAGNYLLAPHYSGINATENLSNYKRTHCQRNYRSFPAGDYLYNFEFVIDGSLPQSIKTDFSSIHYDVEAFVEPSGTFRPTISGKLDIPVVRIPAENSLELIEPITIIHNWRDQLHCKLTIHGKSFSLGSQIPVRLKLSPKINLVCEWIKVYVAEHEQYWTKGKGARCLQLPTKEVLLLEMKEALETISTYPGSATRILSCDGMESAQNVPITNNVNRNLLGTASRDAEIDLKVQLPRCHEINRKEKRENLYIDIEGETLKVNHWIKVVLRFSKLYSGDPSGNKAVEITLQTPFHILSCKATPANIFVPAYAVHCEDPLNAVQQHGCDCFRPTVGHEAEFQQRNTSNGVNTLISKGPLHSLPSRDEYHGINLPPRAYFGEPTRDDHRFSRVSRPLFSAQPAVDDFELSAPTKFSPKDG